MIINVHAGHNPHGKLACGAVGLISESLENRRVKDLVVDELRRMGHTVYDCTVEDGTSQTNVLTRIINKCNMHSVDLDVSIHFNSASSVGANGTEVYIYDESSKASTYALNVLNAICSLGFRNRGVKVNKKLGFLRRTKAPAMLIECCFVNSQRDIALYSPHEVAAAIVYGITGTRRICEPRAESEAKNDELDVSSEKIDETKIYRVSVLDQKGAFHNIENAHNLLVALESAGFKAIITEG
jgi:N-acetylmuramoyl-L-alanine amidase